VIEEYNAKRGHSLNFHRTLDLFEQKKSCIGSRKSCEMQGQQEKPFDNELIEALGKMDVREFLMYMLECGLIITGWRALNEMFLFLR
jgi:hypothetical protein